MIEIFGKTMCPYCDKAKSFCEREGLEYSSRDVFFDMFPSARTFPQIKVNGVAIGGYNELDAWHQNK
jgi:glutaredoxin